MELWFSQLRDIPAEIAEKALNEWVRTQKWSPSISDIRAAAADQVSGELLSWSDAWQQVLTAVRRFGFYRQKEALASLDDLTLKTVQRIGFTAICNTDNPAVERANFRMIYEQLAQRHRRDQTAHSIALLMEKRKEALTDGQEGRSIRDKEDADGNAGAECGAAARSRVCGEGAFI
jgi:hypothetical protein